MAYRIIYRGLEISTESADDVVLLAEWLVAKKEQEQRTQPDQLEPIASNVRYSARREGLVPMRDPPP